MEKKEGIRIRSCVSVYIMEYLESLTRRNYSPKSLDIYGRALKKFVAYMNTTTIERIQDIALEHLEAYRLYLAEANLSNAAVDIYLRTVRSFCGWLEKTGHVFLNPAQGLVLPRLERPLQHVPTEQDIKAVLAASSTTSAVGVRDRAILEVLYSCGLRLGEIAGLTVFSPDIRQGLLRVVGKGSKERVVPLGKQAVFWLKRYMETARPELCKDVDEHALWVSKISGLKLTHVRIDKLVREHAAAAGLAPLSVHAVRRACATHMLRNGAHPVQIQMLLGHSDLKSLSQYLKVSITDMKKTHERSKPGR